MHNFPDFFYFRPIFMFYIIVHIILLIVVIFQNKNSNSTLVNGFTILSSSISIAVVSIILIYQMGNIADELALSGDPITFILFMAVAIMSLINPIVYFIKKN